MKILYMTCPVDEAERIARTLLEERLVACANILPPVRSLYWWEGKIDEAIEAVVVMKTADARAAEALARVKAIHPYQVPGISVVAAETADPDYLAWVEAETARGRVKK